MIKEKVLYYPYINIPNSVWLKQMLLYWDEIGIITPYEYIQNPDKLDNHTRQLVRENLIIQVLALEYIQDIPNFKDSFIQYLNSLDARIIDKRKKDFINEKYCKIHIEKLNGVEDDLIRLGLADYLNYPWFYVEKITAFEFMYYLTSVLCNLQELNYKPFTDNIIQVKNFFSTTDYNVNIESENLRIELLDSILPIPINSISAIQIKRFKDKYHDELLDFRITVEKEIGSIVSIENPELRENRKQLFIKQSKHQIEKIIDIFKNFGFKRIGLLDICSIISFSPIISSLFDFAKLIKNDIDKRKIYNIDPYFLYAAYVNKEFIRD